ncbi:MAG: hypothetical protein ACLP5H_31505 [Desulfomonilaceae bacterium]
MHRLAIDVLNPHGIVALLTGASGTESLTKERKTLGIIQGDAVPQRFIPQLIELYRAGHFPCNRLVKSGFLKSAYNENSVSGRALRC